VQLKDLHFFEPNYAFLEINAEGKTGAEEYINNIGITRRKENIVVIDND